MISKKKNFITLENEAFKNHDLNLLFTLEKITEICSTLYTYLKLKKPVELSIDNKFSTYSVMSTKKGYIVHFPIGKVKSIILRTSADIIDFATNLAHEFGHIKYGDTDNYCLTVDYNIFSKRNIILNLLKETRADLFAKEAMTNIYGSYSFNWFDSHGDYRKTGYFNNDTRLKIVNTYSAYNRSLVNTLFIKVFEHDNFVNRAELVKNIENDSRYSDNRRRWIYKLLFI